jgi:hypothetical protein
VPPTPIAVKWKAKRLGAVDLGAPLVEMTSGDLDGDGRAEIVAVTEDEVLVLAPSGRRALAVVARAPLPDAAASIAPRDPVAAAVVVGSELRVRSSTSGAGARYTYKDGKLKAGKALDAYPLCADRDGALAAGRNYFERPAQDTLPADWPAKYWAAACRTGLVDAAGRALRVDAVLGAHGALAVDVTVHCAKDEAGCTASRASEIDGVGTAFAIADVDRDGAPEVITAADGAPGDADTVKVHTVPAAGGKPGKPLFKKAFSGGVGGIIADDVDGDGDIEVVAAVRLAGASRVDLWLLD